MIVDLFTRPWAQWSYDHMREYGPGDRVGQPLAHLVIQAANVAANVAPFEAPPPTVPDIS